MVWPKTLGMKVFLTGLFLALILPLLIAGIFTLPVDKLGALIALIGIVLVWFDK